MVDPLVCDFCFPGQLDRTGSEVVYQLETRKGTRKDHPFQVMDIFWTVNVTVCISTLGLVLASEYDWDSSAGPIVNTNVSRACGALRPTVQDYET